MLEHRRLCVVALASSTAVLLCIVVSFVMPMHSSFRQTTIPRNREDATPHHEAGGEGDDRIVVPPRVVNASFGEGALLQKNLPLTPAPTTAPTVSPQHRDMARIAILTFCDIVPPSKLHWLRGSGKKRKPLPDVNGETGASKNYFMPALASANHLAYARRHGYIIHQEFELSPAHRSQMTGHHSSPHWAKPLLLLHFLPKYDVIFWIDTDALFMNFTIRIEDLVDPAYDAVFASDNNGLNNGVGIYRNTDSTRDMLQGLMDVPPQHVGGAYDNSALWHVLRRSKPYLSPRVKIVPRFMLNSFPPEALGPGHKIEPGLYKASDFVVHFPGRRVSKLIAQKYFCFSMRINNVTAAEASPRDRTAAPPADGGDGASDGSAASAGFLSLPDCSTVLSPEEVLGERVADYSVLNHLRNWR